MLKNQKGITIMVLVITIIVLMIIVSITAKSGYSAAKQAKFYSAISQMKAMQTKVNTIYEDYINGDEVKKQEIESYGEDLEESGKYADAKIAYDDVNSNNKTGDNIGELKDYRYYSKNYIKNTLDTEGISYDFIINIKTRTAILLNGVSKDEKAGEKYYALCEMDNQQYNVDYKGNE